MLTRSTDESEGIYLIGLMFIQILKVARTAALNSMVQSNSFLSAETELRHFRTKRYKRARSSVSFHVVRRYYCYCCESLFKRYMS